MRFRKLYSKFKYIPVSLCDNVKLAKAKDERAVTEQNTVAAFSMGKKVE